MVIHAATVQLRPVHARERQRICNSKQRTTPARSRSAPGWAPALARVSTSAFFLPARRCYTRSSLSPSFQLFRAPSGHSKCLPHRPAQHAIVCPAFVSVFVNASLAPRCSSFQLVSGPSGHRYLPFHCRYPPASIKSAQTRPRRSAVLARFTAVLARFSAVWPGSKPSGPF